MTIQELLEIEEIKQLKYAYMRCVDRKLWDEMATLFVPEATCSYSAGHYSHEGPRCDRRLAPQGHGQARLPLDA